MRVPITASLVREQQALLRIGGACAIVGTLILIVSLGVHRDLPLDASTETALQFIVDHPAWFVVHLGMIVASSLWIGAFAALAGTLSPGLAGVLGRFLVPSAIVGGGFAIFNYAVDGFDFGVLAENWAAASGPERADLVQRLETVVWLLNGTFRAESMIFYGLTVLLAGLAVGLDGRYPGRFGALGAIAGAAVLLVGLSSFAGVSIIQDWLIFVVIMPLEAVWLLTLGILMWRQAGLLQVDAAEPWEAVARGS